MGPDLPARVLGGAVRLMHTAGAHEADRGDGLLVFAGLGTGFLLGLATMCARRSAATPRVLVSGAVSGARSRSGGESLG